MAASGDLGWTWGDFVVIARGDDGEKRSYGNYVNVWKKDGEGRWRVIADIGVDTPAPGPGTDE